MSFRVTNSRKGLKGLRADSELFGKALSLSETFDQNDINECRSARKEDGFAIVQFASKTKSLEDVFMHVTEGHVQ